MASFVRPINITLGVAAAAAAIVLARRVANAPGENAAFFKRKNVVVTGGSRGLGFVLAEKLLQAGATVTICGRSQSSIDSALQAFEPFGASITGVACDLRDRAACERLIQQAQDRYGPVDILINNAGIIEVGPFADQTIADFRDAMDTHFWAPLYTTLAVLPAMQGRRTGQIVNVASVGGVVGVPHLAPYCASKFAQVGLTQALNAELAASGVRLTSIVPGLMRTGSPDHALFKGRHRAEYAWFTLSDANPLLSVSVDRAARRILRATRRGESQVVIGITAQAAKTVNALLPEATATLLRIAAALLPAPGGRGTSSTTGARSRSPWTQNFLTRLNARAMRRANQQPASESEPADAET